MPARLARRLARLAVALAVLAPLAARAQFATTNVQLLQGWSFHDPLLGYDTASGKMTTLTLNHFSTWKYGDNFAFVDLYRGRFKAGTEANLYAEWHPRLFLNRVVGAKGPVLGIFKDAGLAFELNQGSAPGFFAYLAGVGGDFAVPFGVLGLNVYYRYQSVQLPGFGNFNLRTWQVSPFWTIPFKVAKVPLLFTGFVDVSGANDNEDVDVMAQPQLLVDVLGLAGGAPGRLWLGCEWYLHYNPANPDDLVSAPQAMLQWNLH